MVTHWSNAFSFRTRLTVGDGAKAQELVVPQLVLDTIGAKLGDEFMCVITHDGGINLRKVDN